MAHIVKCRWCGVSFDTDILDSDKWIMANKRYYYHKDCYEEKQKPNAIRPVTNENKETEFNTWRQNIFDFIQRDLKGKCNYSRITQMMEMYKNKYKDWTYKGMFYALKYFYDIKQNDWSKANGAIGILPYIYYEGTEYWRQREREDNGIITRIEQQMNSLRQRPVKTIIQNSDKKDIIKTPSLLEALMEDDE